MNLRNNRCISVLFGLVVLGWYGVIHGWSLLSSDNAKATLFGGTVIAVIFLADTAYRRIFRRQLDNNTLKASQEPQATAMQRLAAKPIPLAFICAAVVACLWPACVLQQMMRKIYAGPDSGVKCLLMPDAFLGNIIVAALIFLLPVVLNIAIVRVNTRDTSDSNIPQVCISPLSLRRWVWDAFFSYIRFWSPRAGVIAILATIVALVGYLTSCTWLTEHGIGSRAVWQKSYHNWNSVKRVEEVHQLGQRKGYTYDKFHFQITFSDHSTWTSRDMTIENLPADDTYSAVSYISDHSGKKIKVVSDYPDAAHSTL